MTARTRALVQRAGRKQHWATLAAGETAWVPVCDIVDVPVFGATVTGTDDWHAWLTAADADAARLIAGEPGVLCSRCRTPLLAAALALQEQAGIRAHAADVAALEAEIRALRAEVARWTTVALEETRKAGVFLRDHVVFRRAAR